MIDRTEIGPDLGEAREDWDARTDFIRGDFAMVAGWKLNGPVVTAFPPAHCSSGDVGEKYSAPVEAIASCSK